MNFLKLVVQKQAKIEKESVKIKGKNKWERILSAVYLCLK